MSSPPGPLPTAASALVEAPAARALGATVVEVVPGRATLQLVVGEAMVNGHGVCHGGVLFGLAHLACALAASSAEGSTSTGTSIELVSPAPLGVVLLARAEVRHARGRSAICDAVVADAQHTVVALARNRSRTGG